MKQLSQWCVGDVVWPLFGKPHSAMDPRAAALLPNGGGFHWAPTRVRVVRLRDQSGTGRCNQSFAHWAVHALFFWKLTMTING